MEYSLPLNQPYDEADELVRNASLVTDLEPYMDDSITSVNYKMWRTKDANEFLESMLEWEIAPVLPIWQWFDPPLRLPAAHSLSDEELKTVLYDTIQRLYEKKIVLECTEHLSDRELYSVITSEILPLKEKKMDHVSVYTHWNLSCGDDEESLSTWLTYYASDEERSDWEYFNDTILPPKMEPLYPRELPQDLSENGGSEI
ncbi:MAG: hypothetical protein Q4G69_01500 [Planctomycetia bacterium]|nr:hypothetical protein [Planctomycetia bacterium]